MDLNLIIPRLKSAAPKGKAKLALPLLLIAATSGCAWFTPAIACVNTNQGQETGLPPGQPPTASSSQQDSTDLRRDTHQKSNQPDTPALGEHSLASSPSPSPVPAASPSPAPTASLKVAVPTTLHEALPEKETNTGGTLRILGDDPPTLDPHLVADSGSFAITSEVFGGLVTMSPNLELIPDLAEKWVLNDTGRKYTFALNQAAKFHNGDEVTANDVKWSLERVPFGSRV